MVHFGYGDIITAPVGINRDMTPVVVLSTHEYDNGAVSYRFRYANNRHRGLDWSGHLSAQDVADVRVVDHDDTVDCTPRSLLQGA